MTDIALDLRPLVNAIDRLREGLTRYQQDTSDTQIRDGLIQRFEFTYELSHKMLKRYLEMASATPEQFDSMPFADLIRTGNENEVVPHLATLGKQLLPLLRLMERDLKLGLPVTDIEDVLANKGH